MSIDNTEDVIDIRDVIGRYESLKASIEYCEVHSEVEADEVGEMDTLRALLDELAGNGGDEQWQGDWYPITLIRDSYFEGYARELAEELGRIKGNESWPLNCIDWKRAARELRMDYTSVEYEGVAYWYS